MSRLLGTVKKHRILVIFALQVVLWILIVPWFFIPLGEILVFGVPAWLVYCLAMFVLYALIVAIIIRSQWFQLSTDEDERNSN